MVTTFHFVTRHNYLPLQSLTLFPGTPSFIKKGNVQERTPQNYCADLANLFILSSYRRRAVSSWCQRHQLVSFGIITQVCTNGANWIPAYAGMTP